jgi:hypothetical protein
VLKTIYELIRFGARDVTKPHEFIGFGARDATKPYIFIGSGARDATKPYPFVRFGARDVPLEMEVFGPIPTRIPGGHVFLVLILALSAARAGTAHETILVGAALAGIEEDGGDDVVGRRGCGLGLGRFGPENSINPYLKPVSGVPEIGFR